MRRTITFVLIIFLILGFTCACNNSYEFTENSEESDIIFKFETKLNENNIVYDRTTLTSNELGAKDCYYYYIEENNPLIVYVFDENNEKYKIISQNKYINKQSFYENIPIIANKGIVIEENKDMIHYESITKILNDL